MDEAVIVTLALLVLVLIPLAESVGLADLVLEDTIVLETEEDPVEVLELVVVLVSVLVIRGVSVPLGERDPDAEPVDVLEGRIESVCVDDAVCVLDCGADLV